MTLPIQSLTERALCAWKQASSSSPFIESKFTLTEQHAKEREIDSLMRKIEDAQSVVAASPGESRRRLVSVRMNIQKSIVQLLHSFGCVIDAGMERSFSQVTDEFINEAYAFDPAIPEDAVYQAARNVMIMNTFQMHLGKPVSLTPSMFAYSLLYPYTDNYLDDAGVNRASKHEANERLGMRLRGMSYSPRNRHEQIIGALVGKIENEFDRTHYPLVYESILAIHAAQTKSVLQQGEGVALTAEQLLDVSFEKGGTSVLADGYLVAGDLHSDDVQFFFNFGVVLQLIDDLQDLEEDRLSCQRTLVGEEASRGALGLFTNRFQAYMTATLSPFRQKEQQLFELIERSCRLLMFEAMAVNSTYYSSEYLECMEDHSPVRFSYLREVKGRLRASAALAGTQRSKARRYAGRLSLMDA